MIYDAHKIVFVSTMRATSKDSLLHTSYVVELNGVGCEMKCSERKTEVCIQVHNKQSGKTIIFT